MKTRAGVWLVTASMAAVHGLVASMSSAAVTDVTGDVILMAPPASVAPGASFGDTAVIHAFVERDNAPLLADIVVDGAPPALPLTITAGTCVKVYYMHYDPPSQAASSGEIRLGTRVLGVLSTQASLDQSNAALGNDTPGQATTYPEGVDCQAPAPGDGDCAPESNDFVSVQAQSIDVELHANGPGDRVRILTECEP